MQMFCYLSRTGNDHLLVTYFLISPENFPLFFLSLDVRLTSARFTTHEYAIDLFDKEQFRTNNLVEEHDTEPTRLHRTFARS